MRRPCTTCPWRVDTPTEHWHPDHFESIYKNCQGDAFHVMLCHHATKSPEPAKIVCQGWARVLGFDAIGVRLAAIKGTVTAAEVNDTEGPELYPTFEAMMKANRIPLPEFPVDRQWEQRHSGMNHDRPVQRDQSAESEDDPGQASCRRDEPEQ